MAEVLSIQNNMPSHFDSDPLRRSSSQTSFFVPSSPTYPRSSLSTRPSAPHTGYDARLPPSLPSSAPSSPRLSQPDFSNQHSYASTPSSSISLEDECDLEENDILFPSYDDEASYNNVEEADSSASVEVMPPTSLNAPPTTPATVSPSISPHPGVSSPAPIAGDDTAVRKEPSRHVDYLSHNWKEEDIWSSWRHIVTKRKIYGNISRLENASWRTWAKSKYRLKTVSPDTLNWMKDHDVTWLYGPLQTCNTSAFDSDSAPPASHLSRSNSFSTKKPILKKRSLSEIMLQRSISSSTLMKQAIAALRAQEPAQVSRARPVIGGRTYSDFTASSHPVIPADGATTEDPPSLPSTSSSGITTPSEKRRIHFNNKVEQCIAINKDGDEPDNYYNAIHDDDDSSDDGILMMKAVHGKDRKLSNRSTPRTSFSNESKTIAMLPSTTLKYRGDTPDPAEQAFKQKGGFWNVAAKLAPSPSQETLKPSRSSNFLLDDEDDEADMSWQPTSIAGRRDSVFVHQSRTRGSTPDDDPDLECKGLRRTPSGMFMPYEEDEDDVAAAGLFGKVVDTVNTARDIAHVIWNVGWRR
ncbi:MAG: hypothetical protein Q9187_007229 [Circinaria calcarea]